MNKVKFLYQVWRHQFFSSTEVFRCATDSWRNYRHIVVELGVNDDSRQFWKFIESCCESVVSLKVENVRLNEDLSIKFPNLETFRAFAIDETSLMKVLNVTEKLKDLFIFSGEATISPVVINCLIKCLQRNHKLEELYLKNVSLMKIFDDELSINFCLKSLKLLNTSADNSISIKTEENLLKFINHHSSTLETLFFEFMSEKIVELAYSLPSVTSLGLLNVPSTANLEKNRNVKSLEIPFVEDFASIKKFTEAAPNVQSLFVACVTNELVLHLSWNFMSLKSLNFKMIDLEAEDFYEKLKSEHEQINQEIEIWDYENVDWD